MKSYIVIGLGRFGGSLARQLCTLGAEVLAMDVHNDLVQQLANDVTHAVVGDARDKEVLRALGVRNFDCAVIAIGDDLAASVLITMNLKELGAPYIRMFSFYLPEGQDPALFRGEVLERLHRMVEEAAAWDSVLLHENEKGIYGDNASRCQDLLEQLAGPHFQAVFDFANFIQVGQETLPAYGLLKPYVAYVHVKDALLSTGAVVPAGQGDGHVRDILADLLGGGWKGFLSLEPHLTDFAGLAALEQDPQKRGSALDGKSAWKLALDSLKEILAGIPQAKEAR